MCLCKLSANGVPPCLSLSAEAEVDACLCILPFLAKEVRPLHLPELAFHDLHKPSTVTPPVEPPLYVPCEEGKNELSPVHSALLTCRSDVRRSDHVNPYSAPSTRPLRPPGPHFNSEDHWEGSRPDTSNVRPAENKFPYGTRSLFEELLYTR